MELKIPIHNRGYARALQEIGEILKEVEAAKEKKNPPPKKRMTANEKAKAVVAVLFLSVFFGWMLLACFALVYDAWHYDDPPNEGQIRWDLLDNEWDRNMHDPTQRPPDSIAAEARLKMLLLEERDKQ